MSKMKRIIIIMALILFSLFSMVTLTACDGDRDEDGLTDSFEEENGYDPDEYTWNEELDW